MFSADLCRAGRGMLNWTAEDLAAAAGLGLSTVWRYEGGASVRQSSVDAMRKALEDAGLEFIRIGGKSTKGGAGVRQV